MCDARVKVDMKRGGIKESKIANPRMGIGEGAVKLRSLISRCNEYKVPQNMTEDRNIEIEIGLKH